MEVGQGEGGFEEESRLGLARFVVGSAKSEITPNPDKFAPERTARSAVAAVISGIVVDGGSDADDAATSSAAATRTR